MVDLIIKKTNKCYSADIMAKNRIRSNVYARIAFGNYCRTVLQMTSSKVGSVLNKNHATILHYQKEHDSLYKYDKEYREKYNELTGVNKPKRWLCVELSINLFKPVAL